MHMGTMTEHQSQNFGLDMKSHHFNEDTIVNTEKDFAEKSYMGSIHGSLKGKMLRSNVKDLKPDVNILGSACLDMMYADLSMSNASRVGAPMPNSGGFGLLANLGGEILSQFRYETSMN